MHKPSWFQRNQTLIVNAKTCGINKDGHEQYIVNPETGVRSSSEIDDTLAECCESIKSGDFSRKEVFYLDTDSIVEADAYVPKYFDHVTIEGVEKLVEENESFDLMSLGELRTKKMIKMKHLFYLKN
jgi:hypothetical protein